MPSYATKKRRAEAMPKSPDLTGQRFGKTKVIKRNGYFGTSVAWLCRCDCGKEHRVRTASLLSGKTKSCPACSGKQRIDLSGMKFGRLTVTEYVGMRGHNSFWHCVCDCGNEVDVASSKLRTGWTQSCGCLHKERLSRQNTTHGKSKTRLYMLYASMKDRCYNENNSEYHVYGGRGIKVCDEWLNDFDRFYEWAINNGYDENAPRGDYTIDRIDNNADYSPMNCRWASIQQQNRRRMEIEISCDGTTKRYWSIRDASRSTGIGKWRLTHSSKTGKPLADGCKCRICKTLKLLGEPSLYRNGIVVS